MRLIKYLKQFKKIALAKDFKHGSGLATYLFEDSDVDLVIFNDLDIIFFLATAKDVIKYNNYYVLNNAYLDTISASITQNHLGNLRQEYIPAYGTVYSFDWFIIDEQNDKRKIIKALLVHSCFEDILNYLNLNNIKIDSITWMDRGDNFENEVETLFYFIKDNKVRWFFEEESSNCLTRKYECYFEPVKNYSVAELKRSFDQCPAVLWDTEKEFYNLYF